jgi:membrane fusion protein (multidrug efflux system)
MPADTSEGASGAPQKVGSLAPPSPGKTVPGDGATQTESSPAPQSTSAPPAPAHHGTSLVNRRIVLWSLAVVVLVGGVWYFYPDLWLLLNTVSTDDAYVNGHVTFVAPRVPGQVVKVYVDDNQRVRKGDLLVQLDPVPYRIQLALKQAAYATAQAQVEATTDQVRGQLALARSNRFKLQHAIESVDTRSCGTAVTLFIRSATFFTTTLFPSRGLTRKPKRAGRCSQG